MKGFLVKHLDPLVFWCFRQPKNGVDFFFYEKLHLRNFFYIYFLFSQATNGSDHAGYKPIFDNFDNVKHKTGINYYFSSLLISQVAAIVVLMIYQIVSTNDTKTQYSVSNVWASTHGTILDIEMK